MRQAGVVAAAGLYALEHHVEDLALDHAHAAKVASAIDSLQEISLQAPPQTNMLMLDPGIIINPLIEHFARHNIKINGHRWVFHRDISSADTDAVIRACRAFTPT